MLVLAETGRGKPSPPNDIPQTVTVKAIRGVVVGEFPGESILHVQAHQTDVTGRPVALVQRGPYATKGVKRRSARQADSTRETLFRKEQDDVTKILTRDVA